MKKIMLPVLCVMAVLFAEAQSQFGITNYTLPQGWIARQAGNDVELVKKGAENDICKITLFQQLNSAVNTEVKFAEFWTQKTKSRSAKVTKGNTTVKAEDDGWVSFSAAKSISKNGVVYTEGFYTLSDGSKTVMILAEAKDGACMDEVSSIITSVVIPEKETKTKGKKIRVLPLKSLKALVN